MFTCNTWGIKNKDQQSSIDLIFFANSNPTPGCSVTIFCLCVLTQKLSGFLYHFVPSFPMKKDILIDKGSSSLDSWYEYPNKSVCSSPELIKSEIIIDWSVSVP